LTGPPELTKPIRRPADLVVEIQVFGRIQEIRRVVERPKVRVVARCDFLLCSTYLSLGHFLRGDLWS
jgi:hypothetical protein